MKLAGFNRSACLLALISFGLPSFSVPAFADDAASANEAADAQERPNPADRPGKASGPITVEPGHFEVESDLVNYIHDYRSADSVTTNGFIVGDPLLKMGITSDVDLELQLGGYQRFNFKDRNTGEKTHAYGFGDDLVRVKMNLMGNDGGDLAVGIIPYVKLPVASDTLRNAGLANTSVEGGLLVPVTYNLPYDFVFGYQAEFDANRNADNGDFHPTFVNIPSISHPIPGIDKLTGLLEFYSSVNTSKSPDDPNIYTLDVALNYELTPKVAIDIETDIGLNRSAPDTQTILGIAWLF